MNLLNYEQGTVAPYTKEIARLSSGESLEMHEPTVKDKHHLTFTCDRPLPWTLDGEYGGNEAFNEVVNCQKALTIIRGS